MPMAVQQWANIFARQRSRHSYLPETYLTLWIAHNTSRLICILVHKCNYFFLDSTATADTVTENTLSICYIKHVNWSKASRGTAFTFLSMYCIYQASHKKKSLYGQTTDLHRKQQVTLIVQRFHRRQSVINSKLQKFLFGTFDINTKKMRLDLNIRTFPYIWLRNFDRNTKMFTDCLLRINYLLQTRPRPWLTDVRGDPTHQHKVLGLTICWGHP